MMTNMLIPPMQSMPMPMMQYFSIPMVPPKFQSGYNRHQPSRYQGPKYNKKPDQPPLISGPSSNDQKTLKIDPIFLPSYDKPEIIKAGLAPASQMNDPEFNLESIKKAEFFILRSSCDDDIHKAIKYGVWTSTQRNNMLLSETFKRCQSENIPLYLIYTVVRSEQYCGLARMTGDLDEQAMCDFWWTPGKWKGVFKVSWVFIKDLDYGILSHLYEYPPLFWLI
jgi:hypothetical protein